MAVPTWCYSARQAWDNLVRGLCHALIEAGRRVYFSRRSDLVQKLRAARRELRLPQEMARLDQFDLLVFDDLSYVAETKPKPSCSSS